MHDFVSSNRELADFVTFLCAALAVVSLTQLALVLTIISTVIAIVIGGFRLHDRIKYGREKDQ